MRTRTLYLTAIMSVAWIGAACSVRIESPENKTGGIETPSGMETNLAFIKYRTLWGESPDFYLVEIEGHKYITSHYGHDSGGIVHAASCTCKQ